MQRWAKSVRVVNRDRDSVVAGLVRIADSSKDRRRGLLDCAGLAPDAGIWIVPCEAIHTFGMQIPIDSVFLDAQLRVTSLRYALKPWRIAVCVRAHSVLELPVGAIARSGTRIGDQLCTADLE